MKRIVHVQQTLSNNCASAVAAMITRLPIDVVTEEFHEDFHAYKIDLGTYLTRYKVQSIRKLTTNPRVMPGHLYIVTAPSLNCIGTFHQLIIDWRDGTSFYLVFDPCKGLANKQYYRSPNEKGGVLLQAWVVDYDICQAPALECFIDDSCS